MRMFFVILLPLRRHPHLVLHPFHALTYLFISIGTNICSARHGGQAPELHAGVLLQTHKAFIDKPKQGSDARRSPGSHLLCSCNAEHYG